MAFIPIHSKNFVGTLGRKMSAFPALRCALALIAQAVFALALFPLAQAQSENPFAWPPASLRTLPSYLSNPATSPDFLASFQSRRSATAAQPEAWLPADPGPIAPPDGVAPINNPVGLALLENAVGTGIVTGEVSDATTLDPISGAVVEIIGSGRTAETDAKGRFEFTALPAGNFNIEASQLGFFSESTVVTVIEGSPSEVRFGLRAKPTDDSANEYTLEEESVVGEYQGDSKGDFNLDLTTDSPNIVAGLSKDDFSKTGAGDAGAAVSKISGANIVGGRYAVVRGLGDRYSNTLFNGALIPSADPSKKAVQLDLFPSDLLESVAISKLFLPELPAEFAGGTVQIQTLRMPEKPIVEVSFGTRWFSERPDGDFMGDPNTDFSFDKINYPLLPPGFDRPNGFTGSVVDSIALHESAVMRPSAVSDEQPLSLSVVLGNTFQINKGVKLGTVFALTRDSTNSYQKLALGRGFRNDNPSTPGRDKNLINSRTNEVFTRDLTFGYMSGTTVELGDFNEIGYTKFYNESFGDNYVKTSNSRNTNAEPVFIANPYGVTVDPTTYLKVFAMPIGGSDYFEPLQRSLDVDQFNGKHILYGDKERGGSFSWMAAKATAIEARPHSRTYAYTPLDFSDPAIQNFIFDPNQYRPDFPVYEAGGDQVLLNGFPVVNITRESLETTDVGENQRADISLPYYFNETSDDHFGLRFGYNKSERNRTVRGRFFSYNFNQINDQLVIENSSGSYQGNYGSLFHQNFNSAFFPGRPNETIFGSNGIVINDFSGNGSTVRNIDAANSIESNYVGADMALAGWSLSGGVRIESELRSYHVLPTLNPRPPFSTLKPVEFEFETVLPGIVLTKKMGNEDAFTLTTGWSRTVARPTFYEFAPALIVDQATGDTTRGNADLINSSITNYDLRLDWAVNQASNIGIGFFTKQVQDPIVDAFDPVINAQSWINGDAGLLNGIEFEANTRFYDVWSLGGNYTFISSNLDYTLRNVPLKSSFTGQPEHILNIFTGYENEDWGLSANLVYNYTGSFLSAAPADPNVPGVLEASFETLDLILQKEFNAWECDAKVTLGIRNILDSTRRQYFDGTDLTFREGKPGRTFSLSGEINF